MTLIYVVSVFVYLDSLKKIGIQSKRIEWKVKNWGFTVILPT